MRLLTNRVTRNIRHVESAERREPGADDVGQIAGRRGRLIEGAAKDVARLVLHGSAMHGGLNPQARFQGIIKISDGDAGHAHLLSSMMQG